MKLQLFFQNQVLPNIIYVVFGVLIFIFWMVLTTAISVFGPHRYSTIIDMPTYQDDAQIHEYFETANLVDTKKTNGWIHTKGKVEAKKVKSVLTTKCIQLPYKDQSFSFIEIGFLHVSEVIDLDVSYKTCDQKTNLKVQNNIEDIAKKINEPVNQRLGIKPFIFQQEIKTKTIGGIIITIESETKTHTFPQLANSFGINYLKLFGDVSKFIDLSSTISSDTVVKPGEIITVENNLSLKNIQLNNVEISMQTGISKNGDILSSEASKVYTSKVCPQAYLRPAINSEIPFLNPCLTSDEDSFTQTTRSNRYQDLEYIGSSNWLERIFPSEYKKDRTRDIVWKVDNLNSFQKYKLHSRFKVPKGYVDETSISFKVQIRFRNSGFIRVLKTSVTPAVKVENKGFVQVGVYSPYENLLPGKNDQWAMFLLNNSRYQTSPDNQADIEDFILRDNESDIEDFILRIKFDKSTCNPLFRGISTKKLQDSINFSPDREFLLDPENIYELVQQPAIGKTVKTSDSIEIYIHRWAWNNQVKGFLLKYDIPDKTVCPIGSQIVFTGEVFDAYDTNSKLSELTVEKNLVSSNSLTHPIENQTCPHQKLPSRDVLRINSETYQPDLPYWPEWRIGLEANCIFLSDKENIVSVPGSVLPGESVMSMYWLNQEMRNNTETLNWYYVLNEIPKGTSYLGTHKDLAFESNAINFHPIRHRDPQTDSKVEIFKADLSNPKTLLMNDPKFNHDNPTNSGWYPVEIGTVPLQDNSFALDNPKAVVMFEQGKQYAVMARAKNIKSSYEEDFFVPHFIMQVCDNTYCEKPEDGTTISFNNMRGYSMVDGNCDYCGQSQFGTVKIEEKAWPKIHFDKTNIQAFSSTSIAFTVTPENSIFASAKAEGLIEFDLNQLVPYLSNQDIQSDVSVKINCKSCNLPPNCDIKKIKTTVENQRIIIKLKDNENNCSIKRGYGYKKLGDACQDNWFQNYTVDVTFSLEYETPPTLPISVPVNFSSTKVQDSDVWPKSNYNKDLQIQLF